MPLYIFDSVNYSVMFDKINRSNSALLFVMAYYYARENNEPHGFASFVYIIQYIYLYFMHIPQNIKTVCYEIIRIVFKIARRMFNGTRDKIYATKSIMYENFN